MRCWCRDLLGAVAIGRPSSERGCGCEPTSGAGAPRSSPLPARFDRVVVETPLHLDCGRILCVLRDILPLDRWYRVGTVIAIVEACWPEALSRSAEYLLAPRRANAGGCCERAPKAGPEQSPGRIATWTVRGSLLSAPAALTGTRSLTGMGALPSTDADRAQTRPAAAWRQAASQADFDGQGFGSELSGMTSRWSSCSEAARRCWTAAGRWLRGKGFAPPEYGWLWRLTPRRWGIHWPPSRSGQAVTHRHRRGAGRARLEQQQLSPLELFNERC